MNCDACYVADAVVAVHCPHAQHYRRILLFCETHFNEHAESLYRQGWELKEVTH